MKTLSFRNLSLSRRKGVSLLEVDSERDGFEIRPGLTLLVAPNGYGKTTFLQTLGGLFRQSAGEIFWSGKSFAPDQHVLYVSEYLSFPHYIYPMEWVRFMAGDAPREALERWIQGFRLEPVLDRYLGRLSQGERRKITWLGAHASPKPILLLDEPLDGLDILAIRAAREMVEEWKKQGRTVVIVAHQVSELLDLSDEVVLFRNQKPIFWSKAIGGSPREISSTQFREKVLEFYEGPRLK